MDVISTQNKFFFAYIYKNSYPYPLDSRIPNNSLKSPMTSFYPLSSRLFLARNPSYRFTAIGREVWDGKARCRGRWRTGEVVILSRLPGTGENTSVSVFDDRRRKRYFTSGDYWWKGRGGSYRDESTPKLGLLGSPRTRRSAGLEGYLLLWEWRLSDTVYEPTSRPSPSSISRR